jgi:endonuclease/exonuclease/phosphatase (EEP) superfamily protein YafD
LIVVHTLQPLANLDVLRSQLRELKSLAARTRGPLVLAGDFNATRQHRPFRQLLDGPLRDAHLARGRGFARSWPADRALPPFALLDHVVVSPHFTVLDAFEADIPGSDHRAVGARLELPE